MILLLNKSIIKNHLFNLSAWFNCIIFYYSYIYYLLFYIIKFILLLYFLSVVIIFLFYLSLYYYLMFIIFYSLLSSFYSRCNNSLNKHSILFFTCLLHIFYNIYSFDYSNNLVPFFVYSFGEWTNIFYCIIKSYILYFLYISLFLFSLFLYLHSSLSNNALITWLSFLNVA